MNTAICMPSWKAPNDFLNFFTIILDILHRYVYNKAISSIFFIKEIGL